MTKIKDAEEFVSIFEKSINTETIDKMDLKTLNFINDLLDGKLTEKQKNQEIERMKKIELNRIEKINQSNLDSESKKVWIDEIDNLSKTEKEWLDGKSNEKL